MTSSTSSQTMAGRASGLSAMYFDVAQAHAVGVADVEAVGGKMAHHPGLGILVDDLGDLAVSPLGGAVRRRCGCGSR